MTLISYAQNLEDIALYRALRDVKNGFYIDVGAYRPEEHSVTKLFYDRGWRGVNVEPCQPWFDELVEQRSRDVNIRAAVSSVEGCVRLYDVVGTGLSTSVDAYADNYRTKGYEVRPLTVETKTLASICDQYATKEIHFLKIDVEGNEREVLLGADFKRYRPWIVMMESTVPETETPNYESWEGLLLDAGYTLAMQHWINRLYIANEKSELKTALSIPVDDYHSARVDRELASLREIIASTRGALAVTNEALASVRADLMKEHQAHADDVAQIRQVHDDALERIYTSSSWKLTAPLRALSSMFGERQNSDKA
jgi:FkbM family methyltransferase